MSAENALPFTGERFTPECVREIFYEHWHRYALAMTAVDGLDVLDVACGEGYGSNLMAHGARSVTGLDQDADAVAHARAAYRGGKLEFLQGDATRLPFADASFDAVVSFETLEHLAEQDEMLAEFRRVLRPDGWLMISTPDRKTYSDDTGYRNAFHVRELYRDEFESLLARHFPVSRLYGQKLMFNSLVWSLDPAPGARYLITDDRSTQATATPAWPPLYYLAVCAAQHSALPELPGLSLFADRAESVYQDYSDEVRRNINARGTLEAYEQQIEQLQAALAEARQPVWRRLLGRLGKQG